MKKKNYNSFPQVVVADDGNIFSRLRRRRRRETNRKFQTDEKCFLRLRRRWLRTTTRKDWKRYWKMRWRRRRRRAYGSLRNKRERRPIRCNHSYWKRNRWDAMAVPKCIPENEKRLSNTKTDATSLRPQCNMIKIGDNDPWKISRQETTAGEFENDTADTSSNLTVSSCTL